MLGNECCKNKMMHTRGHWRSIVQRYCVWWIYFNNLFLDVISTYKESFTICIFLLKCSLVRCCYVVIGLLIQFVGYIMLSYHLQYLMLH